MFSPIEWDDGRLKLLDQTRLPHEEVWLTCATPEQVADAIDRLAVCGAPAIGVSAAYGLVLGVQTLEGADSKSVDDFAPAFEQMADALEQTRPTAVNLRWAIEQGRALCAKTLDEGPRAVRDALLQLAHRIKQEDVAANRRMGQFGAALFKGAGLFLRNAW